MSSISLEPRLAIVNNENNGPDNDIHYGCKLSSSIYSHISVLLLPLDTVGMLEHNYPIVY